MPAEGSWGKFISSVTSRVCADSSSPCRRRMCPTAEGGARPLRGLGFRFTSFMVPFIPLRILDGNEEKQEGSRQGRVPVVLL